MPTFIRKNIHQYFYAAFPLIAYFCMLTFEQGRFDFLGVPREFVELPPQRIAQLGASTVLVLLLLSGIVFFVYSLVSTKNKFVSHLAKSFFWALFFVPMAYLTASNFWSIALALVVSLISPWAFDDKSDSSTDTGDQSKSTKNLAGSMVALLFVALFFVGIFFGFGRISQGNETDYMVLVSDNSKIVVGFYEGKMILKGYDAKTKKIQPNVTLQSGDQSIDIGVVKIGPLVR